MNELTPDFDQREIAHKDLGSNIVVLAGAGTGKTKLLIDRLTALILEKETPIEKIVALTFTKKAAEEMRDRLEKELRLVIAGKDEKAAQLAQKALDDIPKSQIGTIHSFAAHLLRLYPLQAGVDPAFREDEGMVTETVFENLWKEWTALELGGKGKHGKAWSALLAKVELSELRALAKVLISPMVDLNSLDQTPDLKAAASKALSELTTLGSKYGMPKRQSKFIPAYEAMIKLFTLLKDGKKIPIEIIPDIVEWKSIPTSWEEAEADLKRLKATAEAFGNVDEALFKKTVDLLLPFIISVRNDLARRGAISFDGLLVFSRNLLRDHLDVRSALKHKFDTFLVDEFQDTDPLQGEILFYLAEKADGKARQWQDVRLEPGRLFVVGDPKQSIYHFRGADIAAFEAFEEHMLKQTPPARKAVLSANFRSDPRVLGFVNAVFPNAMREEKYVQPAYSPLVPGREFKDVRNPAVKIIEITGEQELKLKSGDRRLAEAEMIADWIEAEVKKGLKYSDVALLLRSAYAFEEYLDAFRRRGIRYLAEGEKSFYQTPEVLDFLNLLAAIANPSDRLALTGVLRSPAGGLTDKEIWEVHQSSGLSYLHQPKVHKEKIGTLFKLLQQLSLEAKSEPLGQMIRKVMARTWIVETASASPHGEQAVANLMKVGRLAEEWNEQAPMTLQDFVERFDRYRKDQRDEGENPLADVKYEAVKVLTIHKAKGLEFPVVCLPNLSSKKDKRGSSPIMRRDWRSALTGLRLEKSDATNAAMAIIETEEAVRELAEEIRVFYVAATRAKSQLVCFVSGEENDKGRFAQIIKSAGDLVEVDREQVAWKSVFEKNIDRALLNLSAEWDPKVFAGQFKKRADQYETLIQQKRWVSPTSLLAEPEKAPLFDEDAIELSRENAINIGHVCHKVLEDWDFAKSKSKHGISLAQAVERACRLYELDTSEESVKPVVVDSQKILQEFIASPAYKKISSAKIIGREVPFTYPLKSPDGEVMRGYIDLLYEVGGELVVADYKTNPFDQTLAKHYEPQAKAYLKAIKKSLGRDAKFELVFLRTGQAVRLN